MKVMNETMYPKKPLRAISNLYSSLATQCTLMTKKAGTRLPWLNAKGKSQIYLLKNGEISVYRNHDNLLLATFRPPHILGVVEALHRDNIYQMRVDTDASLLKIESQDAFTVIEKEFLWQDISLLLAYHISYLCYLENQLIQSRAYITVRSKLIELMNLPESFRMKITAIKYIQQRTVLSRSGILKIFAELKKGQYITLDKGCLVQLAHLPMEF